MIPLGSSLGFLRSYVCVLEKQCLEFLQTEGLTLTSLQFLLVGETGNGWWDVTPSSSGVSIDSDMDLDDFQADADKI